MQHLELDLNAPEVREHAARSRPSAAKPPPDGATSALQEQRTEDSSPSVVRSKRFPNQGVASQALSCGHPVHQLRVLFPAQDFVTNHQFQIAHCAACGFDVTSPQPDEEHIGAYYPAGYYGNPGTRRFPAPIEVLQKAMYAQRVRMVERVWGNKHGRVLDVGCGRGLLLQAFRRRGWEVRGTELSEPAARYALEVAHVPVDIGRVEEIGFPAEHFDAITIWHVLEHIHDPRVVLNEANRILKPGGVLLIGVPNFSGFEARFFRDKWFHLDVPRHVTHLTKQILKQALVENGFQDKCWSGFAPEYDAFSFVQSTLNKCGLRHNLLYNVLRGKQAKVMNGDRTPKWQVAASLSLAAVLGIVSLPATLCAGLLGQAGTMTALAVKTSEVQK
ncbi:MAG: class I SAM-dependent methyltransferase [Candidatus Dormibacteraceae bacterium]